MSDRLVDGIPDFIRDGFGNNRGFLRVLAFRGFHLEADFRDPAGDGPKGDEPELSYPEGDTLPRVGFREKPITAKPTSAKLPDPQASRTRGPALHAFTIPHSRPIDLDEALSLMEGVFVGGFHARGPLCTQLEVKLSSHFGVAAAHLCASGTCALELALRALFLRGKRVAIPTLTCAAVIHAVRAAGAEAILYDHGYEAPQLEDLPDGIDAVVLVLPPQGISSNWSIAPFADLDLPVVVDACQQWGEGAVDFSGIDAVVVSTYATKLISTGSGGAVLSASEEMVAAVRQLNTADQQDSLDPPRHNYPFDDIRAAMGLDQVSQLGDIFQARRSIAAAYDEAFGQTSPALGVVYRYLLDCGSRAACDALQAALAEAGIEAKRPVFRPLHRYSGHSDNLFPRASSDWGRQLSLPCFPTLALEEQDRVIEVVNAVRNA